MKGLLVFTFALFGMLNACFAQDLSPEVMQRIDSAFSGWKTATGPGCAVAITKNDAVVYSKGFGLANLEDGVPNSPESVYYLASLAKQFTGYAIALLIRDKKIDPDADIHTYLTWLPGYGAKISVMNLLHHTSGLRDDFTLLPFTGFNMDGLLSQDMALGMIKKQHTLNFKPGEKFSYCNTNYILLSEIVSKVSGKPFAAFVDSAIFRPLQMTSSRIVPGSAEIIKKRADSYAGDQGGYSNVNHNIYTQGDGGMFSTAADLAKWMRHLYHPAYKDTAIIHLLTAPGRLNNGRMLDYAMGIIPDQYWGQRRLTHKGGLAGYKNFMAVFPDVKTGVIILTNGDDGPKTNRAMDAIVRILLPHPVAGMADDPISKASGAPVYAGTVPNGLTGDYIAHNGSRIKISVKNGQVYAGDLALLAVADSSFQQAANRQVNYHFIKAGTTQKLELEKPGPNPAELYRRVPPEEKTVLKEFVGSYTSTELDFNFTISLKNGRLWLSNNRHGSFELRPVGADDLFTELFFFDHVVAVRDSKGTITALEFASGDTAGLLFNKTKYGATKKKYGKSR
jgi:CubicO group peptidase (beta-lactamase class C family)